MERRQDNRVNVLLEGEEQVFIENGDELLPATMINLSAGGALLELKGSDAYLQAGDTFHLFFDNGGQLLKLNATAVRTNGKQVAFRFSDLGADEKRAIHTKLIRMAIIAARIPEVGRDRRNEPSGGIETCQSDGSVLASQVRS